MYTGPSPNSINENYPDHTYEQIVCLVSGEQKRIIQDRYLQKFGYTKEIYIIEFPGAPLKSLAASESYRKSAMSEQGQKQRSNAMKNLNLHNKEFQENRKKGCDEFWNSDSSLVIRSAASEKAKIQHRTTDLNDCVRRYFTTAYIGSEDQLDRSVRATKNNPGSRPEVKKKIRETYIKNSELGLHNKETKFKKKKYKNTNLIYQSTYELDFLELCDSKNTLGRIKNAPCFSDKNYPYNFYAPDYMLDNKFVIEIKSWYIEKLQEKRCPGLLKKKEQLIIDKGYKFLYIKDKDYSELLNIFSLNIPIVKF